MPPGSEFMRDGCDDAIDVTNGPQRIDETVDVLRKNVNGDYDGIPAAFGETARHAARCLHLGDRMTDDYEHPCLAAEHVQHDDLLFQATAIDRIYELIYK